MSINAHGVINIKYNGNLFKVKGDVSYSLGLPKREAIEGATGVQGYTLKHQIPFIEFEITLDGSTTSDEMLKIDSADIVLELANKKVISFAECWCNSDGVVEVEEGKMKVKFESLNQGKEIKNN